MSAINISDNQLGYLHRLRGWICDRGQRLRKKQLFEQTTELLEHRGTGAKVQNGAPSGIEPGVDYINTGEDDQMEIYGYRRSLGLTLLLWLLIALSCGALRLLFHWVPHWWLYATHSRCCLSRAQRVLLVEQYHKTHRCYHVKDIENISRDDFENLNLKRRNKKSDCWDTQALTELKQGKVLISVHTSGGVFREIEKLRMFKCKKLRYIWDWDRKEFLKLCGLDQDVSTSTLHQQRGVSLQEQFIRRFVYGNNEILVPIKSILELLFLEALNPFYVFQFCSFVLWYFDDYLYYAMAILTMSAFGITMSIIQTRRNLLNLRSTVHSSDVATVVRGDSGEVVTVPTEHLVPGDLMVVPSHGCVMHCDAVLLTGTCIVNESMLTGESVPVTKTSLPNVQNIMFEPKEHARHTLFCGTHVIQTRYFDKEKVLAIVIRTGFSTSKGSLVRSIMYPPPVDFKFECDSYKFVKLLAGIASVGFVYTIVTKMMRGVSATDITLEALDLITVVVPPALPAAMTVGRMYAQSRLQKKNIYCITPRCINVSGSIDCVCFDKTGTLTEDGMDMWGVVPVHSAHFDIPVMEVNTMATSDELCRAMVSCHSLTLIDGKLSGDPLDLKMFESTNWVLEEPEIDDNAKFDLIFPTVVRPPKQTSQEIGTPPVEIGIVRQFPFSSSLQRMSVITRLLGASKYTVYCKGSPEMIVSLSHPNSVPAEFHRVLEEYTQQGYRVLAVATKSLSGSYVKIQRMQRDDVECSLHFIGLVVMENRLKLETTGIIKELRSANIRTVMVTGDNIQTAVCVARNCGMIPTWKPIVVVDGVPAVAGQCPQIFFTQSQADAAIANGGGDASIMSNMTNSNSLQSLATIESGSITFAEESSPPVTAPCKKNYAKTDVLKRDFVFALTGRTWAVLKVHFPELLPRIATRGAVFARMSPDQKQQLVQELQGLGYYVAMCGDGANDCGALKAAHTGISLSEAESSVASPFTSKVPNISCVPSVIREGRAALVTSFGVFKYMAAYSLCQFVSVMILYSIDSNLSDVQYLYIDLFMITAFAFFFGRTEAYSGPLVKTPPLASLISLSPVLSLVFQISLIIVVQTASFYHIKQFDWFISYDSKDKGYGFENYAIFSSSSLQYIILAVVFSKGPPYRKSITSNYGMLAFSVISTVLTSYLILSPTKWVQETFELMVPPDMSFRIILLVYGAINFLLAVVGEMFLIDFLVFKKLRYKFHNIEKSRKKYLLIEHDMSKDLSWPILSRDQRVLEPFALSPSRQPPRSPATITEISGEFSQVRAQPEAQPEAQPLPRQRFASTCGVTLDPGALMNVPKRRTISDSERCLDDALAVCASHVSEGMLCSKASSYHQSEDNVAVSESVEPGSIKMKDKPSCLSKSHENQYVSGMRNVMQQNNLRIGTEQVEIHQPKDGPKTESNSIIIEMNSLQL